MIGNYFTMDSNDVDLHPIFKKLGHNLDEIRIRALNNILSKLEHSVICEADIVQEKHLLIRLLEWFNFPKCSDKEKVLNLLLRLSKHSSAATLLLDIGAINFLTQLRNDNSSEVQQLIDQIVENLLCLPDIQQPLHTGECVYHGRHDNTVVEAGDIVGHHAVLPSQFLQPSGNYVRSDPEVYVYKKYESPEEPAVGYFRQDEEQENDLIVVPREENVIKASCFKFSTFPWLSLAPTDRHVLSTTNSSLKSADHTLVVSTCEFLSDVVLQDFPSEIFLQRPSIIKTLISILSVEKKDLIHVTTSAVKSLTDFSKSLKVRINFYQDPALYTPKQDFSSSVSSSDSLHSEDSRPSVVGREHPRARGDGTDGDTSSSVSPSQHEDVAAEDETAHEDIQALQFMQMSLPQYTMAVLEKCLTLLKTDDVQFASHVFVLIRSIFELLSEAVSTNLFDDRSPPARQMAEKLVESLEMFGELLHHHHYTNQRLGQDTRPQHRMMYVCLAVYVVHLLDIAVPCDKAKTVLPENLITCLGYILLDLPIIHSYPELTEPLLLYVESCDPHTSQLFQTVMEVSGSMQKTCCFLLECKNKVPSQDMMELLSVAEESLPSLPYHCSLRFIEGFVKLSSDMCVSQLISAPVQKRCRQLLLKLLAHPVLLIRSHTYGACLNVLKQALDINRAVNPSLTVSQAVLFLVDVDMLYEVCCFGMNDLDQSVCKPARDIMLHLLQCKLLVPTHTWKQLMDCIAVIMPLLQSYSGVHGALGDCIVGLVETQPADVTSCLPILERLRATVRMLFAFESRIRSEGLSRLSYFLTMEDNSTSKLPVFSELDVSNLSDIFVVDGPNYLECNIGASVLQADNMRQVLSIFDSATIESSVRKSAAEQLSIMLQDPGLHAPFLEAGGLDRVLTCLRQGIIRPSGSPKENPCGLLRPCMRMLRYLLQHSPSLRHRLAHQADIYYLVVRCGFLMQSDDRARAETAHVLGFLLFDEVSGVEAISQNVPFSLPSFLTKRYKLPFKPPIHHITSPHCVTVHPEVDTIVGGAAAQMIRHQWNVAWHNNMEELVQDIHKEAAQVKECSGFSVKLGLTTEDMTLLRVSHLKDGILQCMYGVMNATSHTDVATSIGNLSIYLVTACWFDKLEDTSGQHWKDALTRFLYTTPASSADKSLLSQILSMLSLNVSLTGTPSPDMLTWLCGVMTKPGPILKLIGESVHSDMNTAGTEEEEDQTKKFDRILSKEILNFVQCVVSKMPYSLSLSTYSDCVSGDIARHLIQRLELADAPHFYNLASLERTLNCLMHVSARCGWSKDCTSMDSYTLCIQMLRSLLEVLSAFHLGRGTTTMSFMGKGVTKCTAVCLLHVANEMSLIAGEKDWSIHWLFNREGTNTTAVDNGFNWLFPLWTYRDPEVRAAGLGIAVALTSTKAGCKTVCEQCQMISGGIWGVGVTLLLGQAECSIVREQAALLLVNLTALHLNEEEGPVIKHKDNGVQVHGLTAMLALLHHTNFYKEVVVILTNYCPQPTIHPVSIVSESSVLTPAISENTLTTSENPSPTGVQQSNDAITSTPHNQRTSRLFSPTPSNPVLSAPRPETMGENRHSIPPTSSPQHTPTTLTTGTNTPVSVQGAPGGNTSDTNSAVSMDEYQSVSAPCLVSSVCQLIQNLVTMTQDDALSCLKAENLLNLFTNLLDEQILNGYVSELSTNRGQCEQLLTTFHQLLDMYRHILDLLRTCVLVDSRARLDILHNTDACRCISSLLGVNFFGNKNIEGCCWEMWESTFALLSQLLRLNGQQALRELTPVIVEKWSQLADQILSILQSKVPASLTNATLEFNSLLLGEEAKLIDKMDNQDVSEISALLDCTYLNENEDNGDLFNTTYGFKLCQQLLQLYDQVVLKPMEVPSELEKSVVLDAFKMLLATSRSATQTALDAGLMESIIDHIKRTHVNLNLSSLHSTSSLNKKDDPFIAELCQGLELMRNLLYHSAEAKMVAYECGVANVVHKLWSWCQLDTHLMTTVLALLTTYTAHCPQAASSLSSTCAVSAVDQPSSKHSSNSLVHCLIKLTKKDANRAKLTTLKNVYNLLATLALSSECRGIMWKSNFLHEFSSLSPHKSKKSKVKHTLEILWLQLFVNLSFSSEGQQLIMKVNDVLNLLLEFGVVDNLSVSQPAMLILHNLCHSTPNKTKLLSNKILLEFLLTKLTSGGDQEKTLSSSALWALLYNSQKTRVIMKNHNMVAKLHEIGRMLVHDGSAKRLVTCMDNIKAVVLSLNE